MPRVTTKTVAFSTRNLRTDLRDRLHALTAIMEAKTGQHITMETVVNVAMDLGIQQLERNYFPKLAAQIAAKHAPPPPAA